MAVDNHIRRGHPITFGLLIFFSLIELIIAAWLVAKFNTHHNPLSSAVSTRTRFLLFTSIWTVVGSALLLILFMHSATGSVMTSVASHLVFLTFTWIFWTAGAASITSALGGGLNCSRHFVYCGQLNSLEAFAWIVWILTTFAFAVVIFRGISAAKRGDGYKGQLVTA